MEPINSNDGTQAIREIIEQIASLTKAKSGLPLTEDDARRRLNSLAVEDEDIARRIAAFKTHARIDRTAVLANYELLHGVHYLEEAAATPEELSPSSGTIVAIFRAAEVCLLNLTELSRRMTRYAAAKEWGAACVSAHWCQWFHQTLYSLSQLIIEFDSGTESGALLKLQDSRAFQQYRNSVTTLHHLLQTTAAESEHDIASRDLDDPRRFVGFQEFVNRNYEMIWFAGLNGVRVPGVHPAEGEPGESFYARVTNADAVDEAVHSVDLVHETSLMQFRAYHQVSEIFVRHVNHWTGHAVLAILTGEEPALAETARVLTGCNKLLRIVNDNIKPIVRTLTPRSYSRIRSALGVTSGSHSPNLRRGLFLAIYPLLVRACRLRLCAFSKQQAADDDAVHSQSLAVLSDPRTQAFAEVLRQVLVFHQNVRTWRDAHMQFVKTQIGVSSAAVTPTASISGSENASRTAQQFRETHATDPIIPIYRAILGRSPAPTFSLVSDGQFDQYMSQLTARSVMGMYADVQERVAKRRRTKKSPASTPDTDVSST